MFAQYFHHSAVVRQIDIVWLDVFHPNAIRRLEYRIEAIRRGFVRAHDAEITRFHIEPDDISQELTGDTCRFGSRTAGARDVDGMLVVVGKLQFSLEQSAIGVR